MVSASPECNRLRINETDKGELLISVVVDKVESILGTVDKKEMKEYVELIKGISED